MTADEFRARLKALGMTCQTFADLTGQHPVTVRGWGSKRSGRDLQAFPGWVGPILIAWERHPDLLAA